MAATGSFWHNPVQAINKAATNAYVLGQSQLINLHGPATLDPNTAPVRGRLGGLYVSVDTIAAGATALTVRLCRDAAGDIPVIGDTTALLSTGITTAAKGGATFLLNIPYTYSLADLTLFWKTDVGTCQVRTIDLVWEE